MDGFLWVEFESGYNSISAAAWQTAEEHGFHEDWTPEGKLCLIHSEISECLEAVRDTVEGYTPEGTPIGAAPNSDKIAALAEEEELADAIIRIMDYGRLRNLDVARAIRLKMDYNRTRPYQHGRAKGI